MYLIATGQICFNSYRWMWDDKNRNMGFFYTGEGVKTL